MNNPNRTFCSIYLSEVKKDILKFLPAKAIKGTRACKLSFSYYEVYIPKNNYFPKGFIWKIKAQYSSEAKANLYSHIVDRIDNGKLEDNNYPIVLKPEKGII